MPLSEPVFGHPIYTPDIWGESKLKWRSDQVWVNIPTHTPRRKSFLLTLPRNSDTALYKKPLCAWSETPKSGLVF